MSLTSHEVGPALPPAQLHDGEFGAVEATHSSTLLSPTARFASRESDTKMIPILGITTISTSATSSIWSNSRSLSPPGI